MLQFRLHQVLGVIRQPEVERQMNVVARSLPNHECR